MEDADYGGALYGAFAGAARRYVEVGGETGQALDQQLLRLPFPREALRLGDLGGRQEFFNTFAVAHCHIAPLARRKVGNGEVAPHKRLNFVWSDTAEAPIVHPAEL